MEEGSEQKLLRAGANKVVSPYLIGGLRMAHTVLKPTVVDFIEFTTKSGNIGLQMQEVTVQEGSRLIGMSLEACSVGDDMGRHHCGDQTDHWRNPVQSHPSKRHQGRRHLDRPWRNIEIKEI